MSAGLFDELPKGAISEILVERITQAIIDGELKPGDKLPTEVEFSERLKIGRNTVREAIKILVAFGVLEIRRAEGTFVVHQFSPRMMDPMIYGLVLEERSLPELVELKVAMLRSVMYLAVEKADDAGVEALKQSYANFSRVSQQMPGDLEAVYAASADFYYTMGEISKNPMLAQLNNIVLRMSKFSRMQGLAVAGRQNAGLMGYLSSEHFVLLLEAIEKRDKSLIEPALQKTNEEWRRLLMLA